MKIALIGYGKMGHAIERIALERGHKIVAIIDADNLSDFDSPEFLSADIAIEFTTPKTAVENYHKCFQRHIPVVSGTTSWGSPSELSEEIKRLNATFFWTSNFSIGVNIFFRLNRRLAKMMASFPQYVPQMKEIHHIHKLDHPSGTAKTLAEDIIALSPEINSWSEDAESSLPQDPTSAALLIEHEREGEVPGTHIIKWTSEVDAITIEHRAFSREGFALGAVMAAEWSRGRHGILSMDTMIDEMIDKK